MNPLTARAKVYWDDYYNSLPPHHRLSDPQVEASMPGDETIADGLVQLYLQGRKMAGSSLIDDYLSVGDKFPSIGKFWIVLDSTATPRCILRTDRVEQKKFRDVGPEVASAEGEGDLSLTHWRKAHAEFFQPFLEKWGIDDIEESTVVTEFFSIVYK